MKLKASSMLSVGAAFVAAFSGVTCWAQGEGQYHFLDAGNDAVLRRSDIGANAPIGAGAVLPDLISVSVCGWSPTNPLVDPYIGEVVRCDDVHIFRLQVVLAGLVNPPGTVGSGGDSFDPFRYGPSPVFGYIEIDMDGDRNTGGEIGTSATTRYLANVSRFGALPEGSISQRAARTGFEHDYDEEFYSEPYFERSGTEFELALCGCFAPIIACEGGDGDGVFDAGETWVVRGRFFQRAGGYRGASGVFGGSDAQAYDPLVNLQFKHEVDAGRTTITLVYALDMQGAATLTGEPVQGIDGLIDIAGSHSSVAEAIQDVIDGAEGLHGGPLSGPVWTLSRRWEGESRSQALEVDHWEVTGLVGTACLNQWECLYVWTDVGFDEHVGDLNGDSLVDQLDVAEFDRRLCELDGTWRDADGEVNGVFVIKDFSANFDLIDFDYDGMIGANDRAEIAPPPACLADFNGDGSVNSQDFFDFLSVFFEGLEAADVNLDGYVNSQDFFDFLIGFFAGC